MKAVIEVELKSHLKALRLPTVLREYQRTAADAATEGLDYETYLLRLLQCEISDREARSFQRLLKLARLPAKKTIAPGFRIWSRSQSTAWAAVTL